LRKIPQQRNALSLGREYNLTYIHAYIVQLQISRRYEECVVSLTLTQIITLKRSLLWPRACCCWAGGGGSWVGCSHSHPWELAKGNN